MRDQAVIGTEWEEEQRACSLVSWASPLHGARTREARLASFGPNKKRGAGPRREERAAVGLPGDEAEWVKVLCLVLVISDNT
jgi:hypothetical protein